ncbi:MAG: hypothetical protein KR126chlam1_00554 [Chlamydiae bacterium]|nr:hypothetical protein [Chlamydiota bacterium]
MIEVEKKVSLEEEDLSKIEQMGTYLGASIITDTYFDTPDFRYTTSDIWLREREARYELKVGVRGLSGTFDRYEEVVEERPILQKLGLDREKDLSQALPKAQIFPYASFQTIRRKYQIDAFTLDLDLAYFDDFIYRIAEVELMVSSESKIPQAEESLEEFLKYIGINTEKKVKPKLIEFLSRKNPTHYHALQVSGIVD